MWVTTPSLTIRVSGSIFILLSVVASQSANSREILRKSDCSSSRSSRIIDFGVNRKLTCDFLLVLNSNFGRSSYRFRDIDAFSSKIARFRHTTVWRPIAAEGPAVSTKPIHRWSEKYTQWATIPSLTVRVYFHSFSRCWLPYPWNPAKFRENLNL